MGLKIRLGLALSGLLMSTMFGVNMLTGIKDYVDTTGNIMVDIADGIGMVSKGIEYLEFYLDPDSAPKPDETSASSASPSDGSAPDPAAPPPPTVIKPSSGEVPGSRDQPAVICQKGKCYPYDPNRMKNPNINLEMKPGMILTPQAAPQGKQGKQQRRKAEHEDDEDSENRKRNAAKKGRR